MTAQVIDFQAARDRVACKSCADNKRALDVRVQQLTGMTLKQFAVGAAVAIVIASALRSLLKKPQQQESAP